MRTLFSGLTALVATLSLLFIGTLGFCQDKPADPPEITVNATDKVVKPEVIKFEKGVYTLTTFYVKNVYTIPTNYTDVTAKVERDGATADKLFWFKASDAVDGRYFVTSEAGLTYLGTVKTSTGTLLHLYNSTGHPAGFQFVKLGGLAILHTEAGKAAIGADDVTVGKLPGTKDKPSLVGIELTGDAAKHLK